MAFEIRAREGEGIFGMCAVSARFKKGTKRRACAHNVFIAPDQLCRKPRDCEVCALEIKQNVEK